MILYEFEGKQILASAGIAVPNSQLLDSPNKAISFTGHLVLKAQVLSGHRAKCGGIVIINSRDDLESSLELLFKKVINGEKVGKILVEERVECEREYYLSISYDTDYRQPLLTISAEGGTGVEERGAEIFPINMLNLYENLPKQIDKDVLKKLIDLFFVQDCLLLEINPLVQNNNGVWYALDAKIKLDDTTFKRHPDWNFEPRSVPGYNSTEREIEAKKIDVNDYRGTAGSAYFDLDGSIAILASGGGASLTAMDELIRVGGKPANYTEYSGNPPKEKVAKLTKIVLSKANLDGLWVVGAIANFTDIYETLSGFIEGLRAAETELKTKFNFPIVIRRGGPRDSEAFEMLKEVKDFDLHLYGEEISITESARIMVELAREYREKVTDTGVIREDPQIALA